MFLLSRKLATVGGCAGLLCMLDACATSGGAGGVAPAVTPAMLGAAGGASLEKLNEGRKIFAGPCISCHQADPIQKYSVSEWEKVVAQMAGRAKLDESRRSALLAYLSAARQSVATRGTD